jgi:hypothetical protein
MNSSNWQSWPARIERAARAYAKRQFKGDRRVRELELLNRHAKELNAEGDDSAKYQLLAPREP